MPYVIVAVVCLALGIVLGLLVARMRSRAGDVVVAVNGVTVDKSDFYRRLENAAGAQVLRDMVMQELQFQYARKIGVAPTEAQVEARFVEASQQPNFAAILASRHEAAEDFKRSLRANLAQIAVFTRGVAVTDAEVRSYYNANIDKNNPRALYYTPAAANIAVIVTPTEEQSRRALAALAAEQPFATVAAKYSADTSKTHGGVLPTILYGRTKARSVPGLEKAVFDLSVGQQIGPRKFAGAWWIIRCLDKKSETTQPYAQVAAQCRNGAMLSKVSPSAMKSIQDDYAKFQSQATIQAFWERYKQAVNFK